MHEIIMGLIGGGSLAAIITSIFSLWQNRKNKQDEILDRLGKIKEEQEKTEKDALRTQLLVLIAYYPGDKTEILTAAQRYFDDLRGDWYMTPIFNKWLLNNDIGRPEWFDPDK